MSGKTSGGQIGNDNAGEGRRWREAIKRALSRDGGDISRGLDTLASKLVEEAKAGKPWALEHIAERMDGKAIQHVSATIEHTVSTGEQADLATRLRRPRTNGTEHTVQ